MLHPDIFAALDILWGPHTTDIFSSFRSRQLPRFNRHWANLCSEGVDAFSFRWDNENNGYSHHQNSSQECCNIWLFQKQKRH